MKMKQEDFSRDDGLQVVCCSGQAAYLADPDRLRFLEPFIGRECTAGEAAGELGVSVQRIRYHIGRQLELQLVRQVYERKRAGRAMKALRRTGRFSCSVCTDTLCLYRGVAGTYTRIARRRVDSSAKLLGKLERPGRRIYRKPDGEIWNEADLANVRIYELLPLAGYDIAADIRLHRKDA